MLGAYYKKPRSKWTHSFQHRGWGLKGGQSLLWYLAYFCFGALHDILDVLIFLASTYIFKRMRSSNSVYLPWADNFIKVEDKQQE